MAIFRSRENALRRRITESAYPVINALSNHSSVVASGQSRMPALASLTLGGISNLDNFLPWLRAQRFEELTPNEWDSSEPDLPYCLVQDAIDVANSGMLISAIRPLESVFDPSHSMIAEGCLFVSIASFAEPSVDCALPPRSGQLGKNSVYDKYFCLAFFLKYGSLDVEAWNRRFPDDIPEPGSQTAILAPFIASECIERNTIWAIVTDGVTTALIQLKHFENPDTTPILSVTVETEPFQLCLARLIAGEARDCDIIEGYSLFWRRPIYLGALKNPQAELPLPSSDRFSLTDFDIFTIQREKQYWDEFLVTQRKASKSALTASLTPGFQLQIRAVDLMSLRRSPVPFPDIPQDTLRRLRCDSNASMRIRDDIAAALLEDIGESEVTFSITDVLRAGKDLYSQTVTGFVNAGHGRSGNVCLKLYDERLFKVPKYELTEEDVWLWYPRYAKPHNKVPEWTTAEDMARREWAAYERLKRFQGFVVPHAYGVFEFQLPDGHCCIGLLMEFIPGKPLHQFAADLLEDEKGELITDIRHAVRVLRYAQIHQRDWNMGNILISSLPARLPSADETILTTATSGVSEPSVATRTRAQNQVVLIDFAFTFQHFFLLPPTPVVDDLVDCQRMLCKVFDQSVVSAFWFDSDGDENEW